MSAAPLGRPVELVGLVLAAIALACAGLLPLGAGGPLGRPDLVYCLVAAWVLRTPRPLAVPLIAGLGLFADLMLSRPVGLGALGLLLVAEVLRARARGLRALPFPAEWLAAVAGQAAVLFGMQALLHLTFAPGPGTAELLRSLAATALVYPVVALLVGRVVRPARAAGHAPGLSPRRSR